MVDCHRRHRLVRDHLDSRDLALQRMQRKVGEAVIAASRRGVLQNDNVRAAWGWAVEGLDEPYARWCEREGIRRHHFYHQSLPRAAGEGDPVEQLISALSAAAPGQYAIVGHPAYDNEEMRALGHPGYPGEQVAREREWQRRIFTDPRILRYCRENGVTPIRYDEAIPL